ncbi:MAG: hypothetical protein HFI37_03440 [Lachnospiraceae bacterium]|nr:hypothetical protein [Lachnospiraceae bacterium]
MPAKMLIPEEDLIGSKDPKKFCEVMYKKTFLFGIVCVLYGMAGIGSEMLWKSRMGNSISLTIFIIVVLWYCREMRKARQTYIK